MLTVGKYPHTPVGRDRPYTGIENLQPEMVRMIDNFMLWQGEK